MVGLALRGRVVEDAVLGPVDTLIGHRQPHLQIRAILRLLGDLVVQPEVGSLLPGIGRIVIVMSHHCLVKRQLHGSGLLLRGRWPLRRLLLLHRRHVQG